MLRSILSTFLLIAVFTFGAVYYLMAVPITENNVTMRIIGYCLPAKYYAATFGVPAARRLLGNVDCQCFAETAVKSSGAKIMSVNLERVRKVLWVRLQDIVTFKAQPDEKVTDALIADRQLFSWFRELSVSMTRCVDLRLR